MSTDAQLIQRIRDRLLVHGTLDAPTPADLAPPVSKLMALAQEHCPELVAELVDTDGWSVELERIAADIGDTLHQTFVKPSLVLTLKHGVDVEQLREGLEAHRSTADAEIIPLFEFGLDNPIPFTMVGLDEGTDRRRSKPAIVVEHPGGDNVVQLRSWLGDPGVVPGLPEEQWAYSLDGEHFDGDTQASRVEAYEAALIAHPEADRVWTGRALTFHPVFDGDSLVELLEEQAYGECGEVAEGWPDADAEDLTVLAKAVNASVTAWMKARNHEPRFFSVQDVQEHDGDFDMPEDAGPCNYCGDMIIVSETCDGVAPFDVLPDADGLARNHDCPDGPRCNCDDMCRNTGGGCVCGGCDWCDGKVVWLG